VHGGTSIGQEWIHVFFMIERVIDALTHTFFTMIITPCFVALGESSCALPKCHVFR
jgi:hypothetical protein